MTTLQHFPASLKEMFERCMYVPFTALLGMDLRHWLYDGYGRVPSGKRGVSIPAHRLAYEYANGPIPEGLQIDHLCRIKRCINPDHLEAVTPSINVRRGLVPITASIHMKALRAKQIAIPRTHCPRGHELTVENVRIEYQQRDGTPIRKCRECRKLSWERSRQHRHKS